MADGEFVVVWQVPAGDDSVALIGNFATGYIEKYEHFDKFVPPEGGGYVVFWHEENVGKFIWVKPSGEKFFHDLRAGERGDAAFVTKGELWISAVNPCLNSNRIFHPVGYAEKAAIQFHDSAKLFLDGDRPAVWDKVHSTIEYLDENCPQRRRLYDNTDKSFTPMRFGSWLLFQTLSQSRVRLYGFDGETTVVPVDLRPEGPYDIFKIVGDRLLIVPSDEDSFYIFVRGQSWKSVLASHKLPSGCKAERLRIVGNKAYCWSTVGSTLNLFRIRI